MSGSETLLKTLREKGLQHPLPGMQTKVEIPDYPHEMWIEGKPRGGVRIIVKISRPDKK